MSEIIQVPFTRISDDDSLDLNGTHVGASNESDAGNAEAICFAGFDSPELSSCAGPRSKLARMPKASGGTKRCHVRVRDTYGRRVGTVGTL